MGLGFTKPVQKSPCNRAKTCCKRLFKVPYVRMFLGQSTVRYFFLETYFQRLFPIKINTVMLQILTYLLHVYQYHGEEHVKKLFSTAVIVNEDTHSNLVRGHCFTGEDTNIFHPWSLKLEGFFRKSTNISFYMVTNLFIYTTGSSHIIDDCSRAVCFGQSLIGLQEF